MCQVWAHFSPEGGRNAPPKPNTYHSKARLQTTRASVSFIPKVILAPYAPRRSTLPKIGRTDRIPIDRDGHERTIFLYRRTIPFLTWSRGLQRRSPRASQSRSYVRVHHGFGPVDGVMPVGEDTAAFDLRVWHW